MVWHRSRHAHGRRRRRAAVVAAALVVALVAMTGCTAARGPAPTVVATDTAVGEAAAWHDRMLAVGRQYFSDDRYSIITGDPSTLTGPTVRAQAAFRATVEGEVWWEGELLTTAPTGCPPGSECQDRDIDGTPLTFSFIEGGEHDGWAWISYDGPRVRSRVLLEPNGEMWPLQLERVASLLTHPFWQDLPASQSVTTG